MTKNFKFLLQGQIQAAITNLNYGRKIKKIMVVIGSILSLISQKNTNKKN